MTVRAVCLFMVITGLSIAFAGACGSQAGDREIASGDSSVLAAQDYPNDGICTTGSTDVTSATLTNLLGNTITAVSFLHLPYGSDDDIPFICGKGGTWDPTRTGAFDAASNFSGTDTIASVLQNTLGLGAVFICNSGFGFEPDKTGEGLHEADTYRGELTISDGTTTIRVRLRFTVSGRDANKTLSSLDITAADIVLRDSNNNDLTTVQDVINLFAANPASVEVRVVSDSVLHITAIGRIICWEQI